MRRPSYAKVCLVVRSFSPTKLSKASSQSCLAIGSSVGLCPKHSTRGKAPNVVAFVRDGVKDEKLLSCCGRSSSKGLANTDATAKARRTSWSIVPKVSSNLEETPHRDPPGVRHYVPRSGAITAAALIHPRLRLYASHILTHLIPPTILT